MFSVHVYVRARVGFKKKKMNCDFYLNNSTLIIEIYIISLLIKHEH